MPIAGRVIIGIENVRIAFIKCRVTGQTRSQYECFEEPTGMGQMPLGRADLRCGLNHEILGLQWLAEELGGPPDPAKRVFQSIPLRTVACLAPIIPSQFFIRDDLY